MDYSCSAHTRAGSPCRRAGTHLTATGRRYCTQHAAELNAGRPSSRPIAVRPPTLSWAQAADAAGQVDSSNAWHGFEEGGFGDGAPGHKALCGLLFSFIGPRRQPAEPVTAGDPMVCYPCSIEVFKRAIVAKGAVQSGKG
jgi:hypothetical protein